jgi:hypothetical protein
MGVTQASERALLALKGDLSTRAQNACTIVKTAGLLSHCTRRILDANPSVLQTIAAHGRP